MDKKTDSWIKPPKDRTLQVFAFDPSLNLDMKLAVLNRLYLTVPWESDLKPGPVGEYLEVVDIDPASGLVYPPVNLNEPALLVQDGLSPSEGTPQFHQQMVYAVVTRTIQNFEKALGRPALWAPYTGNGKKAYVQQLRLYPHALREANAYYSPVKKAILFGYFPATAKDTGSNLPGGIVFTCLSHDIIAHETTHALLDGLHPYFNEPSNPDVLALHEAFADVVALFQHFSYPDVLRSQIARTRGDLTSENLLGELAQQMGQALGNRGALRSAIGEKDVNGHWQRQKPAPERIMTEYEPHNRGSILVAAIFDAFLTVYQSRTADLLRIATGGAGILPTGEIHPDLVNRLAEEAARVSRHILNICIRALDYCPPFDITFGEYLRALITADYDVVPVDTEGYRIAFMESFRRHGIYPSGVRNLSEESLLWSPPQDDWIRNQFFRAPKRLREIRKFADPARHHSNKRDEIFQYESEHLKMVMGWFLKDLITEASQAKIKDFRQSLFLYLGITEADNLSSIEQENGMPSIEINSIRPAYKVGPDGATIIPDLIIEVIQHRRGYLDEDHQHSVDQGKIPPDAPDFMFRGGATLLISAETGEVRYIIGKRVGSNRRLDTERNFLLSDSATQDTLRGTYFDNPITEAMRSQGSQAELFAMLHRNNSQAEKTI